MKRAGLKVKARVKAGFIASNHALAFAEDARDANLTPTARKLAARMWPHLHAMMTATSDANPWEVAEVSRALLGAMTLHQRYIFLGKKH